MAQAADDQYPSRILRAGCLPIGCNRGGFDPCVPLTIGPRGGLTVSPFESRGNADDYANQFNKAAAEAVMVPSKKPRRSWTAVGRARPYLRQPTSGAFLSSCLSPRNHIRVASGGPCASIPGGGPPISWSSYIATQMARTVDFCSDGHEPSAAQYSRDAGRLSPNVRLVVRSGGHRRLAATLFLFCFFLL